MEDAQEARVRILSFVNDEVFRTSTRRESHLVMAEQHLRLQMTIFCGCDAVYGVRAHDRFLISLPKGMNPTTLMSPRKHL